MLRRLKVDNLAIVGHAESEFGFDREEKMAILQNQFSQTIKERDRGNRKSTR